MISLVRHIRQDPWVFFIAVAQFAVCSAALTDLRCTQNKYAAP
jgi:hypothetical protein